MTLAGGIFLKIQATGDKLYLFYAPQFSQDKISISMVGIKDNILHVRPSVRMDQHDRWKYFEMSKLA